MPYKNQDPARRQFGDAYRALRLRERWSERRAIAINQHFYLWELSGLTAPSDTNEPLPTNSLWQAAQYAFERRHQRLERPNRILAKQDYLRQKKRASVPRSAESQAYRDLLQAFKQRCAQANAKGE